MHPYYREALPTWSSSKALDEGLAQADAQRDRLTWLRLNNLRAHMLMIQTRMANAVEHFVAVRRWSNDADSPAERREIMRATQNLASALGVLGDTEGAHSFNLEALRYRQDENDAEHLTRLHTPLVHSALDCGDVALARDTIRQLERVETMANPILTAQLEIARAHFWLNEQRWDDALSASQSALQRLHELGDPDDIARAAEVAARASLELGRVAEAKAFADRMIEASQQLPDSVVPSQAIGLRAHIARAEGDHDHVYRLLEQEVQLRIGRVKGSLSEAFHGIVARFEERVAAREAALLSSNEALAKARDEAQRAATARHQFLSSMSHEIRTPLHGVLGNAELLGLTNLDPAQREMLQVMERSARMTLGIVDDILDLRKLEEGRLELDPIPFRLEASVDAVVDLLRARAEGSGTRMSVVTHPGLPEWVVGDDRRLQQVVLNLVSNAVKFTTEGEVRVELSPDEGGIRFEVIDTGIGIEEGRQVAIFDAYAQANRSTARTVGGTGLGLPISRHLISLMGGDIQVASSPGRGSRFWFVVDLPSVDAPPRPPPLSIDSLAGAHILVAEDDAVNRMVIERMLASLGANPVLAEDGRQAVDQAKAQRFDVMLLDLHMPQLDGPGAARRLRELGYRGPILALTASVMEEDRQLCLQAGMNDVLHKPLTRAALARSLSRWLDRDTST